MSSNEKIIIEDDFVCLRFKNDAVNEIVVEKEQPNGIISL